MTTEEPSGSDADAGAAEAVDDAGAAEAVDDAGEAVVEETADGERAAAASGEEQVAATSGNEQAAGSADPGSAVAGTDVSGGDPGRERGKSLAELDRELEAMDAGGEQRYCANCGSAIDPAAEICPACGVRQDDRGPADEKDPGVAALLSFVLPGVGNMYNEQMERGVAILVAWVAWLGLGWFVGGLIVIPIIGALTFGLGLLLWFVPLVVELLVHVVAAYDAYNQTKAHANGRTQA